MAKKSRNRASAQPEPLPLYDGKVVGPREPCPCGSGKRYKVCHGVAGATTFVKRPFEGLPGECDLVAMRELVPAATAPLTIKGHEDRTVLLASLLPVAAPAMSRDSGQVWAGLQVQHGFGDPSREVAAALLSALESAEAGESRIVGMLEAPGPGPRLQDIVADDTIDVTVHEGFDFWLADVEERDGLEEALQRANDAAMPTARLTGVEAAYWTNVGTKEHLRWVMPEPEDELLTALARLHASGADVIVPGARFVGMFRALGLLAPVWDLPVGTGAEALEEPATAFKAALDEALADTSDLTPEQRSARAGLANRQVTIR
ncbi:SEC-C motif-containing protein [Nocardioides terrae]|uniref:SEC-C motif-containing protein n=1 Tax=Nocardioides terrae TaxID=574651 RepID=A0A1I1FAM5_9ACTN|nr:DUF5926 family protein [Nocardioides terrae]SFB94203.1 SEC-C motif-containing protein [Nocardioides terrae]